MLRPLVWRPSLQNHRRQEHVSVMVLLYVKGRERRKEECHPASPLVTTLLPLFFSDWFKGIEMPIEVDCKDNICSAPKGSYLHIQYSQDLLISGQRLRYDVELEW